MSTWIKFKDGTDEIALISRAEPHKAKLDSYIEIPVEAFAGQRWDGEKLTNQDVIITKEQVNAEAKRRIYIVVKATDEQDSVVRQGNLRSEYSELQDILIDGGALTDKQAARRKQIQDGNGMLKAIVVASNVLTAEEPIPLFYKDDLHWPVMPPTAT